MPDVPKNPSPPQPPSADGVPFIPSLEGARPSADFVDRIPIGFARDNGILGLEGAAHAGGLDSAAVNGHLIVAVRELGDLSQIQTVARLLGRPVRPVLAPAEQIAAAINAAYQKRTGQARELIDRIEGQQADAEIETIQKLDRRDVLAEVAKLSESEDLLDVAGRAPVIKLVNLVLFEAVQARASDVHIQPYENSLVVRLRIDGVLYDAFPLPPTLQDQIVSRVKIMGRMNIAEKRLAQDGRATVQVGDRAVDLRIATLPTSFGERVVVRLLDKTRQLLSLEELGMESDAQERFRALIAADHGIVLVTGPTGGGKTTTLYAALRELNAKELNILTLEDPIEYRLEGISQTQVSEKKGMTFASGLRSVLRQDPDIIMVGEIRDRDTAVMAIQSALTGHLVFSTLHTNDAAGAVSRLLDLGIEPYLLASSVIGVLAQRLVRRVCPACAVPVPRDRALADLARLGVDPSAAALTDTSGMRFGPGCDACRGSGYQGRRGIFELLEADDAVRRLVARCATAAEIKSAAQQAGMKSLRDDGVAKILAGVTTADEVLRATMRAKG